MLSTTNNRHSGWFVSTKALPPNSKTQMKRERCRCDEFNTSVGILEWPANGSKVMGNGWNDHRRVLNWGLESPDRFQVNFSFPISPHQTTGYLSPSPKLITANAPAVTLSGSHKSVGRSKISIVPSSQRQTRRTLTLSVAMRFSCLFFCVAERRCVIRRTVVASDQRCRIVNNVIIFINFVSTTIESVRSGCRQNGLIMEILRNQQMQLNIKYWFFIGFHFRVFSCFFGRLLSFDQRNGQADRVTDPTWAVRFGGGASNR